MLKEPYSSEGKADNPSNLVTILVFPMAVIQAIIENKTSSSQSWRKFAPVPLIDQNFSQPCVHVALHSSIIVASRNLLHERLFVMYKATGKSLGQELGFTRVFADFVDLVDVVVTAAAQKSQEFVDERIANVASERERVVERVHGFDQEG